MSFFAVELKKISKIQTHPNADRLEIGQVDGMTYQFVIQKGSFSVEEYVIFFPVDSVLPQELIKHLNIRNFLSGNNKNRVKTCVLRGISSQGLITKIQDIKKYLKVDSLPTDLTTVLGVTKYDPPEIMTASGNLVKLPECAPYYDIEGCDRFPDIVDVLMDLPCAISEKLEGSNMATVVETDNKVSVCQHGNAIENLPDHEEHTFWKIARKEGLIEAVNKIQKDKYPDKPVVIRSEALGSSIQGDYYGFKKSTTRIFDIYIDRKPVDFDLFMELLKYTGLENICVPIVSKGITLREWLAGRTIQQASNGESVLVKKKREGIVIKPMKEQYLIGFGRLIIKQRDPIYLAGTK